MGGDTTTTPAIPPPIDYTAAMGMASSNGMIATLSGQGVETSRIRETAMNRSEITAAHLELGLERLDERLEEAKLNFRNERLAELNRHDEKTDKIKGDHEEKMAELKQPDKVDSSDFLA